MGLDGIIVAFYFWIRQQFNGRFFLSSEEWILLIVDGSLLERGPLRSMRTGRMENRPAIRCLSSSWSDPSVEMEWRTDSESSLADACHLYSHSTIPHSNSYVCKIMFCDARAMMVLTHENVPYFSYERVHYLKCKP